MHKIIHSFWTKPYKDNASSFNQQERIKGGFSTTMLYMMSWAYSCLTYKKHYKNVELITDQAGFDLLITNIGLPYDNVLTILDELNHYNSKLWAIGKIKAYALQDKPFLHVDSDTFIWSAFKPELNSAPLICQNLEMNHKYYLKTLENIFHHFDYIPESIAKHFRPGEPYGSINAGILGGNNIEFYQEYTKEAFDFVNNNQNKFHLVDITMFNLIFEQFLYYYVAKQMGLPIVAVCENETSSFSSLLRFDAVPFEQTYIHMLGASKKSPIVSEQIALRLLAEYPDYFYKIEALYYGNVL